MNVTESPSWRNWNRNLACRPARIVWPGSVGEVVSLVRDARRAGRVLRPLGSGYSYTPLVETADDMVSLDRFTGVERVDLAAGTAVVKGGTPLYRMIAELARHGAAIEGPGDIDRQTIAGATATGTHGTGIALGSLSSQVQAVTLVDGRGEVRTLDPGTAPELFSAARISLGALGIVVAATIRVMPLYHLRIERGPGVLADVLARLSDEVRNNRNFEFYWYPASDLVYYKRMNVVAPADGGDSVASRAVRWVDDYLVENLLVGASCEAVCRWPGTRDAWLRYARRLVPTTAIVQPASRAYPSVRLLRHHETEYAVPAERASEVIAALEVRLKAHRASTMIPIEFRFTAAEDMPLSPSYGRDIMYVAVHAYHREEYRDYFAVCEELLRSFDGRPHWGKLHGMGGAELRRRYPLWDDFVRARRQLDPNGVFLNDYLRDHLELA